MKTTRMNSLLAIAALGLAASTAGCRDDTTGLNGTGAPGAVSLSIGITQASAPTAAVMNPAFYDLVIQDGASTLNITRVAMVMRDIELEKLNDSSCDDIPGSDASSNDECEKFTTGPMILELPLDGSIETVIVLSDVPPDTYDEVEFEIHKPDDDTPGDLDFLARNPDFRRVSIRVEGDFDGQPFVYLTDLMDKQEHELFPPITVDGASSVNVSFIVDVDTWFRRGDGSVVDPATGNKGQANENLVKENIRRSIDLFEDDDRNGHDDSADGSDDS